MSLNELVVNKFVLRGFQLSVSVMRFCLVLVICAGIVHGSVNPTEFFLGCKQTQDKECEKKLCIAILGEKKEPIVSDWASESWNSQVLKA